MGDPIVRSQKSMWTPNTQVSQSRTSSSGARRSQSASRSTSRSTSRSNAHASSSKRQHAGSNRKASSARSGSSSHVQKKQRGIFAKILSVILFPFMLIKQLFSKKDKANSLSGNAYMSKKRSLGVKQVAALGVAGIFVAAGVIIYPAARDYHNSIKDYDTAQAELAAVEDRNAEIEDIIANLKTDDGMEDYVRAQYGWTKDDENAVLVTGLSSTSSTALPASVSSSSVTLERTKLQKVLDVIFPSSAKDTEDTADEDQESEAVAQSDDSDDSSSVG